MCDCFLSLGSCKSEVKCQNDRGKTLLIEDNDYDTAVAADDELRNPTEAMALSLTSWLNGHRLRYLILILSSPLLIPILCAISPILCAAEVCFRLYRHHRSKSAALRPPPRLQLRKDDVEGREQVKTELNLLDRYLDDQLGLALEILRECGGELGYDYGYIDDIDSNRSNVLC